MWGHLRSIVICVGGLALDPVVSTSVCDSRRESVSGGQFTVQQKVLPSRESKCLKPLLLYNSLNGHYGPSLVYESHEFLCLMQFLRGKFNDFHTYF